jgi:tripartite-type tricarboxylate transporter receptor subunit TctC
MPAPTARIRLALVLGGLTTLAAGVAGCAPSGEPAEASEAFSRPIDFVVPFGAGGGADSVARAVGDELARQVGTDLPVINVPGATGSSGMANMLTATPGRSIAILIQDTLATVPAGSASFSLDEVRGVCRLQSMPSALLVRSDTWADIEELVAASKEADDALLVATVGTNSVDDIVLAALEDEMGARFRAVPFSEPGERFTALLGGEVDVMYEQLGDVRSFLDSGDFVPLVVFADQPVEGFEKVPLAADLGLPDEVVLPQFRGIVTNADATDSMVDRMSEACGTAIESDAVQEFQSLVFADKDSYQPAEEFQQFLEQQEELIAVQLEEYGLVEE